MHFDNIKVYNFAEAFRGMRNPKDSWDKSDSYFGYEIDSENVIAQTKGQEYVTFNHDKNSGIFEYASIGPNDMKLAQTLIKGGAVHRKFMRQIFISMDITAPLYWWKEMDTYKVATTANSTSTMHTIHKKPIELNNFELDDYHPELPISSDYLLGEQVNDFLKTLEILRVTYLDLIKESKNENLSKEERQALEQEAKRYWKELIRWNPQGWLQTRTWTGSYETALAMCSPDQRRFHKQTEWSGDGPEFKDESLIKVMRTLPYAQELIFIDELQK